MAQPTPGQRGYQARAGPRQSRVNTIADQNAALRAEAIDKAQGQKAMVAANASKNLWVDPITRKVYKVRPKVLTQADFTRSPNAVNAEGQIGILTNSVPNGIEYMFAPVRRGSDADRTAPYLYGSILLTTTGSLSGTLVIKILSPSRVEKERVLTTNSYTLNVASPIDWNNRLFFNCEETKRAKAGDFIQLTLVCAEIASSTNMAWTMTIFELEEQ